MVFSTVTKQRIFAFILVVPQLIITFIFFLWPALRAILQSFFFADAFGIHKVFAGLTNFRDLFEDGEFYTAVKITILISTLIVLITMAVGLSLALAINHCKKGQRIYKTLVLWPYAVAPAVAAILWRFICQPSLGWIAVILKFFGIEFSYLTHPFQALALVVLTASWQQLSYNFLFFFVALKAIPQNLIDAALLDGASYWQRFWQIIFPLLSPTMFFLLIMNFIYGCFDTFGIINILTNGGPASATTTLIYKIYKDGFIAMDLGSAAVQSLMLMLMVVTLTLVQFRYIEKKVHYS